MARLGRGSPASKGIARPVSVFDAYRANGIDVQLVAVATANKRARHGFTVDRPQIIYAGPPVPKIRTQLARIRPQPTHSKLLPPTVLGSPAAGPVFPGPLVKLAPPRSRAQTVYGFGRPLVTFPVLAPPIRSRLVRARPPAVHSKLSPPVVLGSVAASPPIVSPTARLANQEAQKRITRSVQATVFAPTVISAEPTLDQSKIRTRLAPQPRQPRRPVYGLARPALVSPVAAGGPPVAPITVKLAWWRKRPENIYGLGRPLVTAATAAPPVETKLRVKLARREAGDNRTNVLAYVQTPTVVSSATIFPGADIRLAPSKRGTPKSKLGFTRVFQVPTLAPPVRRVLVPQAKRYRRLGLWRLYPPTVLFPVPHADLCHLTADPVFCNALTLSPDADQSLSASLASDNSLSATPASDAGLSIGLASDINLGTPEDPCP